MKKTECKGKNFNYLGHFSQQKYLDKGHNLNPMTSDESISYGNAEEYDTPAPVKKPTPVTIPKRKEASRLEALNDSYSGGFSDLMGKKK